MLRAGLYFGLLMALKERADAVVTRLRKAQLRREARRANGMDDFRRAGRRKSALLVLR
jgi:hypothetical protein